MIKKASVKRILVVNLTNIGDCIMTIPVLSVLKAEFPDARIDMILGRAPLALFQGCPEIGKLFVYDKKWSLFQKWLWVRIIAKEGYDLVVDLRHTLIPLLVGAKYRTPLIRIKKKTGISVREKFLKLLHDLKLNTQNHSPISLFSDGEAEHVRTKLSRKGISAEEEYVVIAPGGNSSTKLWTVEGFESIIRYLVQGVHVSVVLVGSSGEKELSGIFDEWARQSGIQIVNLIGETSLRELAALLANASVVLSNDSSTLHLAQELKVKVVGLFGPTNHNKYSIENDRVRIVRLDLDCSPCEQAQCRLERRKCLDDLEPERVKQAIHDLMKSSVFKEVYE